MKKEIKSSKLAFPYERLRFIRVLANLTRDEIEEKYSIPETTLRKWETARIPLTDKGINRCLTMYKNEGVVATKSWILQGIGPRPYLSVEFGEKDKLNDTILNHFKNTYNNCVLFKVTDELMLPRYGINDTVIGDIYIGDIEKLHNCDCIVLLENDDLLLRRFLYIEENTFALMCTNSIKTNKPVLYNVSIKYIAPVLWIKTTIHD